ncbi:dihydropyrimidinase [Ruegeria arenilitoris]|uniref:dihydropyrimidinase n=1 Tax=Ruegeria arenilitoris TaxID=1173585 RepID=UPI00147C11B1|nr:dihydropyrimidinase [Ruegeria arenilitoris]
MKAGFMSSGVDLVIHDGRVVTPEGIVEGDLAITDGRIVSIGTSVTKTKRRIFASGKWVMPGGVDPHAHIEQMSGMGLWNADTFETATKSAAMGGTTSVISFAAQARGQLLSETVADYAARAARGAMIDYAFHLTVTDTEVDEFDNDLAALINAGHRSLKVFTTYNIQLNDGQLLDIFEKAKQSGALVCVHAENDAIIAQAKDNLIRAGHVSPLDHARSRPRMAEIEAVERICRFAEYLDQPVMLFHISTSDGASAIAAAKARGAPVWAETCTHYLLMTEEILDKPGLQGAKWMCSPPQRTKHDQDALWAALLGGTLSLVSSDHAPYRFDESGKLAAGTNPGFHQIANGLPGLETRLPILFNAMVTQGRGGPQAFAELTSHSAARIYGLQRKGAIAEGMDADIVVWDPEKTVTYGTNDLHDNVGYNPWAGYSVTGWPDLVMLRGQPLVQDGVFLGSPGNGKWIHRPFLATKPNRRTAEAETK